MTQQDVIEDVVAGRFVVPETGHRLESPIRAITVASSLDGAESELIGRIAMPDNLAVVSDATTFEVFGRRVAATLGNTSSIVLDTPIADRKTAEHLIARTRHSDGLIAVGSGTVNDLCKWAAWRTDRPYAVFATAPSMNGYVTGTASLSVAGHKQTLPARAPLGAFFDLGILAAAPVRLLRAGLGDVICRATAQTDWLLAHLLLGTAYMTTPFTIQADDEALILANPTALAASDPGAVHALTRLLLLSGLGMLMAGSSHPGSMGEHAISHYIDMMADPHPGSLHGEQVGVAALSMARLQDVIVSAPQPPVMGKSVIDADALRKRYGDLAQGCIGALERKALDDDGARRRNRLLQETWPDLTKRLSAVSLPPETVEAVLRAAGAPITAADLGLDIEFYANAVRYGREIRDRYSCLDLAADAGLLDMFVAGL